MGKSKKKRSQQQDKGGEEERDSNPLLTAQRKFITSLPKKARSHFFSPTHITPEQRAEIWEDQADLGEKLVDSYAWATPAGNLVGIDSGLWMSGAAITSITLFPGIGSALLQGSRFSLYGLKARA